MRLTVAGLRRVVKHDLRIEFTDEQLTSYGGLELVRRYWERIHLVERMERALHGHDVRSDYGSSRLLVLVLTLLVVGARRLEHLRYLAADPLVLRVCRLTRLPAARTVANWLKQFTRARVAALGELNEELVCEQVRELGLRRLTLDIDGTVVRTGPHTAWAQRGYNPHHPKDPSYYPLLAHVAQTGQILRLRNRPGNVHDSRGAVGFVRALISAVRARCGRALELEFRMDAAFFQCEILRLLERRGCAYAIKVPFWSRGNLKPLVAAQREWQRVTAEVSAFETLLPLTTWGLTVRVVVYRKRVGHPTRKNFQLDLFSPDDGTFEYSAVTTNTALTAAALWAFMAGRGAQERTLAELKGEFALDVVPTRHYGANSAWQQLSILAHNLMCGFQLATIAPAKPRSRKRTYAYVLRSMRTLRFLLIGRAGRLCRPAGRQVLRLSANPPTQQLYEDIIRALAA